MSVVLVCLLSPLLTGFAHLVLQRAWLRTHPPVSPQAVLVKLILFLTLVYTGFAAWAAQQDGALVLPYMAYMFFGVTGFHYAYFNLFNMSETARRVNICVSCFKASKEGAAKSWSPQIYSNQYMVETRLNRLVEMGAIKIEKGKYFACDGWILKAAWGLQTLHSIYFPKRK